MLNVQHFIVFLSFAAVLRGSSAKDFHGTRPKEIPSTGERQAQSLQCPSGATESSEQNYGCILNCRYYPYPGSGSGFIQKQPDYTTCGSNGQCLNGKCFQTNCVDSCVVLATEEGKTLTNIKVFNSANLVYCQTYNQVINSGGFSNSSQCELPGQTDFYAAGPDNSGESNDNNKTVSDTGEQGISESDVFLPRIFVPNDECKKLGSGTSEARNWNNGCYFRCVINGRLLPARYIQPDGTKCGNNYSCLFSKCQKNSCIDNCNSIANGGQLKDIIQEDFKSDEAYCYIQGHSTLASVRLDSPSKCEANYPADEDTNGGGSSGDGSSETGSTATSHTPSHDTKNLGSGNFNAGGNHYLNNSYNSNSTVNQGIVNKNEHNSHQNIGK